MRSRRKSTLSSRILFSLLAVLLSGLTAGQAWADVCVWRDPERTMARLFPQAQDYKTVTVKLTPAQVQAIEQTLGTPVDPSEKAEMNFYEIVDAQGKSLGTVMALAGKGEYGAIEVVIGIDPASKIIGAYIQRSRERSTSALQSPAFLKQFVGTTWGDPMSVGMDIRPASGAEDASRVVAFTIRKMLIFHHELLNTEASP